MGISNHQATPIPPLSSSFQLPGSLHPQLTSASGPQPPQLPTPKAIVLFVPGNPGLVDYYIDFLSSIHASFSGEIEVIGLGHLGHSVSEKGKVGWWKGLVGRNGLAKVGDMVENHAAAVDGIRDRWGSDVPILLIGHSVGAFIGCEVIKSRPDSVDKLYALFPTISHIAATPNGRRLAPLFWTFTGAFLFLLQSLLLVIPNFIMIPLVSLLTNQRSPASKVTAGLVSSPQTTSCTLVLARDEMELIKDLDRGFLEAFGEKVQFYWASGEMDGWVPSQRSEEILECLGEERRHQGWFVMRGWYMRFV